MKCKCKAKPKPEVTWFRGTTAVQESSKIKIDVVDREEDVYELTLEIKVCFFIIHEFAEIHFLFFRIHQHQTEVPTDVMSKTNMAKATQI